MLVFSFEIFAAFQNFPQILNKQDNTNTEYQTLNKYQPILM